MWILTLSKEVPDLSNTCFTYFDPKFTPDYGMMVGQSVRVRFASDDPNLSELVDL